MSAQVYSTVAKPTFQKGITCLSLHYDKIRVSFQFSAGALWENHLSSLNRLVN